MDQRAATLWYHDHRMDFTGPQVYRGLAGFHLVRDDEEDALGLPSGERELPLMICDRAFEADGSFRYPSIDRTLREVPGVERPWMEGVLGDVVLVNGAPWPVAEVGTARYRLRILNASNARRYRLALSPGGELTQIGSDGGLLAAPVGHTALDVAPAERFDVVVDFAAYAVGSEVTLVNSLGAGAAAQVMRFRVVRTARRMDDQRAAVRPVPDRRSAPARRRGGVALLLGPAPPGARAPRPVPGTHPWRAPTRAVRRRLEGHRRPATRRGGRRGGAVHRPPRPVPDPLPQPGARGHGDDGRLRHNLTARDAGWAPPTRLT